jgi:PKD repeat protein
MKKIFLLIALWVFTLPLFAQNAVSISGTVIDINTGAPLALYPVTIQSDSSNGFFYYNVVYTNPNGYFQDLMVISPSATQGMVHITVVDCQQYPHSVSLPYDPGNMALTAAFSICFFSQGCDPGFSYTEVGTFTVQFTDQSIGGGGLRSWDFGDGTSSTELNPIHTYPGSGYYNVYLFIGAQGTSCWNYEMMTILVHDSIIGGCHAFYASLPDSVTPKLIHFNNYSVGYFGTYIWEFGDGTTQTVSFPANPNIDHQYASYGDYSVCLTVVSSDTLCTDSYCSQVVIWDSVSSCQAGFTYLAIPGAAQNTIQFIDQSISADSIAWNWFFNDPGSGILNNSTIQNPIFTFSAAGTYNVCLTISGPNCYDVYCFPVVVGQNTGCQANFTYYPDSVSSLPNSIKFVDLSSGNPTQWYWDFGDPASGTMNASTIQNPTHQYTAVGTYMARLIISGNNCSDTIVTPILVGQNVGCQAFYTYAPVPGASPNVFQFTDASVTQGPVSWFWNFDDGTVSTEQNPMHTFPAGPVIDPYFVCLTITSSDSICINTLCLPVIPQYQGCQAEFDALPAPNALLTMNFNDQSQGAIWTWTWDFGDGTTQTVFSPDNPDVSHTYQAPGFYTVCLTIQGDFGFCNSTFCELVAVYDSMPGCQAQYTYYADPTSGTANAITFIDLSIGNPTQWYWEFGDPASGLANVSAEQNPVHAFSAPGNYYVCLTIGGPNCQSVWCGNVEVGPVTFCVNYFTYTQIGQSVNFEGFMVNGVSELYGWDFGDNELGTGQNIVHTYSAQGTYFVTLTTMDPATGCTYSSSQVISVGDSTIWGQVYGQVLAGNFPLTQGLVFIFSLDTNNNYLPYVDISVIDSSGVYYFPMVPQGNYFIYAIPFENGYLPTYYGNTLNWQNATFVQLGTPNNPYNINLIQSSGYQGGNGTIGGQVIEEGDISATMIDKVTMLLKDESGNTILYSQVDAAGNFTFPQLAYGIYYLYAELAGCETEAIQVIISEANPTSMVMLTLSGNSILRIYNKHIALDAGVVYPNPVKTDAQITVILNVATELNIELYSMTGQLIYTKTEPVNVGETTVLIQASQIPDGIYMLKMYTEDGLMLTRKLIKTK